MQRPIEPTVPNAAPDATPVHWSRVREGGTTAGLRLLHLVHRVAGRRAFAAVLHPIAWWFFLTRTDLVHASRDFLGTHASHHPEHWRDGAPTDQDVRRHFRAFGESMLDKALAWSAVPEEADFTLRDPLLVRRTLDDPRGQLVIGSHFGTLEYCRGFMRTHHARTVNVLVFDRHSARFVAAMARLNPDSRLNVHQVDELDLVRVLALKSRLESGEWLFIAGDRVPASGSQRTVDIDFLGRPAAFPVGPYLLGRTLGCPVKLMFAWREADTVHVDLRALDDRIELPRGARDGALATYAERFAAALAERAGAAPFQWFNFFPYWSR